MANSGKFPGAAFVRKSMAIVGSLLGQLNWQSMPIDPVKILDRIDGLRLVPVHPCEEKIDRFHTFLTPPWQSDGTLSPLPHRTVHISVAEFKAVANYLLEHTQLDQTTSSTRRQIIEHATDALKTRKGKSVTQQPEPSQP